MRRFLKVAMIILSWLGGWKALFAQAPTNLALRVVSSAQICLDWRDNSTSELGFEIERSLDGRTFTKIADVGANTITFCNTGLVANTNYTFRVRAKLSATVFSGYTAHLNATTFAAPAAPTSLVVGALSSSSLRLTWEPNTNQNKYAIERRQGQSGGFTEIAVVEFARLTTRQYNNTGLNPGTEYCYRVRIKEDDGETSAYSVIVCATTSPVAPAAPARLMATAVSGTQINLTWADLSDNETGFEVERSLDNRNFTKIAELAANATTFSNTGLNPNVQYCYRVRAKNVAGTSAYTESVCITTLQVAPAAPARLVATAISSSQINVQWADLSDNETGFELERSNDGTNFAKLTDLNANTTAYSNAGLSASTRYWYRIRAKNTAGSSAYSNTADATTQPPPVVLPPTPTGVKATLADYDQIRVEWNALPANVTSVIVERSTNATAGFAQIAQVVSGVSYLDIGLNEKTTYYYRLRSVGNTGQSPNSVVVNATTPEIVISVRPQLADVGLLVYANENQLYFQNQWPKHQNITWKLYQLNGSIVEQNTLQLAGYQKQAYAVSGVKIGSYIMQILSDNQIFITKIKIF